jgi:hypothetical protein
MMPHLSLPTEEHGGCIVLFPNRIFFECVATQPEENYTFSIRTSLAQAAAEK